MTLVKIGISINVANRLAQLKGLSEATVVPATVDRSALEILAAWPGSRSLERSVHVLLASRRVEGEWFDLGPDAVDIFRRAVLSAEVFNGIR